MAEATPTQPTDVARHHWLGSARLWLMLDQEACGQTTLEEVTAEAIAGGADAVVLRLKHLPDREVVEAGQAVRRACRQGGVPLVVSHCLAAAEALAAEAFHTGAEGLSLAQARRNLGTGIALGYSAHSAEEAVLARDAGADYVFLGPMYDTPSKRAYGLPPGPLLLEATRHLGIPRIAIGGINPSRVPVLIEAGASGVAVISWICAAQDPRARTGELARALSSG